MADTESMQPVVTFKKRGAKANARKRVVEVPPTSDSNSDSGFESSEDENGRHIKRRKKRHILTTSSRTDNRRQTSDVQTTEGPTLATSNADNATKTSDWFDEDAKGNKVKKSDTATTEIQISDGNYKGAANYQSFVQKNPDRLSKQVGPQKTSSNVRTITVTDYAPDVCKDYKQTGFCGFGDSCKFLHAREAYEQGWQLDRDWEISTKGKKLAGRTVASADRNAKNENGAEEDEALLEKIPFACIICKKSYSSPIVTKCGHYFCENCALQRYRKDPSCAACGAGTGGVFNVAKKLKQLLERKRERQKQKREKAIADGEEPPPVENGE